VREIRSLGSVEGALGNQRSYSDFTIPDRGVYHGPIQVFSFAGICKSRHGILFSHCPEALQADVRPSLLAAELVKGVTP
jgi:hypothetical protein